MMQSGLALAMLSIAISQGYAAAPHPRILLDPDTLVALRQSTGGNAQWNTLKEKCDGYLPGVVFPAKTEQGRYDYFARGGDYAHANSRSPNIGMGYQGGAFGGFNGYWDSILNLGVC